MGFSDAIYWSLVPDWVNWVTVEEDGRCYGWASKPSYSDRLGRWLLVGDERDGDYMQIPDKDPELEGIWGRTHGQKADFVLVAADKVGDKLKAQFSVFLKASAIELSPAQRKLSAVILEAAAGDSHLMKLLTDPASGLSFVLKALDAFGDEKKRH